MPKHARFLILSDLHRELFADPRMPRKDPGGWAAEQASIATWVDVARTVDGVILAGDIDYGTRGIAWAAATFPFVPTVYVPGNHEYWGDALGVLEEKMRAAAQGTSVTVLAPGETEIAGVRILGATLWTDFAFHGDATIASMAATQKLIGMRDYQKVRRGRSRARLMPLHTIQQHHAEKRWLAERLEQHAAHGDVRPLLVVSHHVPHARGIDGARMRDALTPAYVFQGDDLLFDYGPLTWVHGHTHWAHDSQLGDTRLLSNPRGYAGHERVEGYDPSCVLELAVP